ncbi:MAG: molybdopterin-dependent oxidoreductase [Desulfovibrionaceae bacterium]|nr:molybdopterin-dependent oxidoreductase [Desulfovibrionaceae bacterium]
MASSLVYSLCGMCNTRCPVEIHCENGKARWVCGNRHVPSGQALCPRGAASLALYADPDRIQTPLIRQGERGGGQWRAVSWDEALDYVADKLKAIIAQHGGRSVLLSERPGTFSDMTKAFMQAIGSPNYSTHDTACAHNVNQAAYSLTGRGRGKWVYDYKNCKHLVVQGRNIFEALTVGEVNNVLNAQQTGCRLTCVEVRPTVTGAHADENICIRPGTDYALNLAVLHTLITEKLYNSAFVTEYVQDFAALCAFVQPYSPEWAAQECDITATSIRNLAHALATAAPHVIWHAGWMSTRYTQSLMVSRSAYLINALLGSLGSKGGLVLAASPKEVGRNDLQKLTDLYPESTERRADGVGWRQPEFAPESDLLQESLKAAVSGDPYPIKAYITMKHDPLTAMPDPQEQKAMLAAIDLLVSVTFSWSDTAWHSDVVLPMHTFLEQDSLLISKKGLKPQFQMQRAALAPRYDTKPDWWIFGELARRLGKEKLAFATAQELWAYQLQGTGVRIEDFDDKGFVGFSDSPLYPEKPQFYTPSGKIEVIFTPWQQAGWPSLIAYKSVPRLGGAQFRLVVGRNARHTQSHTQNNPLLHASLPNNSIWIAQERADALGIQQGEVVRMTAANGWTGNISVHCVQGMAPDALFMLHGFGHRLPVESKAQGLGLADQEFMSGGLDIIDTAGRAVALQEHFVTLSKLEHAPVTAKAE